MKKLSVLFILFFMFLSLPTFASDDLGLNTSYNYKKCADYFCYQIDLHNDKKELVTYSIAADFDKDEYAVLNIKNKDFSEKNNLFSVYNLVYFDKIKMNKMTEDNPLYSNYISIKKHPQELLSIQTWADKLIKKATSNFKKAKYDKYDKNIYSTVSLNETMKIVTNVNRAGELVSYKIVKDSDSLRDAALEAIKLTFPFEPMPDNYTKDAVDIELNFALRNKYYIVPALRYYPPSAQ